VTGRKTAGVKRAFLRLRDQLLDEGPQLLGLGFGRLDRAVLDQRLRKVPKQREALLGGAPKLPADFSMSHLKIL
jgi:hypothetical protein